jgi:phage major head subunit gpT-like protein
MINADSKKSAFIIFCTPTWYPTHPHNDENSPIINSLLDTTKPIKPLIFQQRKKPQIVAKNKATDDNVFFQKEYIYGVDSRDNAGYGLWQLAFGSTGKEDKPSS